MPLSSRVKTKTDQLKALHELCSPTEKVLSAVAWNDWGNWNNWDKSWPQDTPVDVTNAQTFWDSTTKTQK
jgi:hypothetical protein